jgi:hypothetical protein
MKFRRSIGAAAAAVVLATTGALSAAASAQSTTTTLKVIAVTKSTVTFSMTSGGEQDTLVNAAGKTVGYDMLYFGQASAATGSLDVTFDLSGGFLYGTAVYHVKTGAITDRQLTGGTGSFAGATGTFTPKPLNKSGTRTLVKIVYSN